MADTTTAAYAARPCRVTGFEGRYSVFDPDGNLVRNPKALVAMPKAEARAAAERLNRDVGKRKLCRACRHLFPINEIVGGRCAGCGPTTRPPTRKRRVNRGGRRL